MKKWLRNIIPALIFLAGLGVLLYPTASDLWNQHRQNRLISQYAQAVSQLTQEDFSAYKTAAQAYNRTLDSDLHDAFSGRDPEEEDPYWSMMDLDGTGVMGHIEIPKISVRLALYHGTGAQALQQGIGHLAGTSLPVGGAGTHCVLSGHRGLPSALLLTDLDQLTDGDVFYLYVLGETLAYEVDQVLVVEPDDVSALALEEGRDYVTLVTCTPYGVNTHRLLVRGRRIEGGQTQQQQVSTAKQVLRSFGWQGKLVVAMAALAVLAFILLTLHEQTRQRGKRELRPKERIDRWRP